MVLLGFKIQSIVYFAKHDLHILYIQKYDIIKQYLSKRCNNCKREMTVEILLFYPVKNVDLIEKWPKLTYFIHIYTYIL